ncbi:type II secretion system F family protein [Vibrio hepatarius]|uniref:type II secretion system F family protein n=1 Tax=Vibrio hepatarius TaxID=171383 RepID=UPI003735C0D6
MILSIGIACLVLGAVGVIAGFLHATQYDIVKARLDRVARFGAVQASRGGILRWARNPKRAQQLAMLGYVSSQAESIFMTARASVMTGAGVVWLYSQQLSVDVGGFAQSVVIALIAGIAIDRALDWRVNVVRQEIAKNIPDALDLMVVCVSSGQSLEATFNTVGQEMKSISPALSREWLVTATEMAVLDSPQVALTNLDTRLALPEVNNMIVTMSQALKFGTPMADALKLIAADNRQYHMLELEEWVGKIPAKMSFPLVVFIMLPVVVIIVAPMVLSLFQTLGQL